MEELTPDNFLIGIIGGKGKMGRWFHEFFQMHGFNCLISDVDTELKNTDVVRRCNFIMIATPMDVFEQVIDEISPHIREDALLTDICSLKYRQVNYMLSRTNCAVIGTHPLFGPYESHKSQLRFAICPGRDEGGYWTRLWQNFLMSKGMLTTIVDAMTHDKYMAIIQALNHLVLLAYSNTLKDMGVIKDILKTLATPSFERQLETMLRLIPQDPLLYGRIQMDNPFTNEIISNFERNFTTFCDIVRKNDLNLFKEKFIMTQEYLKTLK